MLTLPPSVHVYVAAEPTDLRKSFDGLSAMVAEKFGHDPLCGHLFVFRNKRGDQIVFRNKRGDQICVLFWDRRIGPEATSLDGLPWCDEAVLIDILKMAQNISPLALHPPGVARR